MGYAIKWGYSEICPEGMCGFTIGNINISNVAFLCIYLVGGFKHFIFHSVGNFIIPTDFHSYFSEEWLKPPTRYMCIYYKDMIYVIYIYVFLEI